MSKSLQSLRALVSERLTAAAEEIFALVERTIAEYEEELCRSKEENQRKQQLLEQLQPPQPDLTHIKAAVNIKQEEEPQPLVTADCVKHEVDMLTEHEEHTPGEEREAAGAEITSEPQEEQTDEDEDCEPPASTSTSASQTEENKYVKLEQMETTSGSQTNVSMDGTKARITMKVCPFCEKLYRTQDIKRHMSRHTDDKPFRCTVCHKGFTRKFQLTKHVRTQLGCKPFSCTLCNMTFSEEKPLNSHMMTHSGERPFRCTLCHRGYIHKSMLTRHMRTHSTFKPFRCSVCPKGFYRNCSLVRHMKIHSAAR